MNYQWACFSKDVLLVGGEKSAWPHLDRDACCLTSPGRSNRWPGLRDMDSGQWRARLSFLPCSSCLSWWKGSVCLGWPLPFYLNHTYCSSQASHCSRSFSKEEWVSLSLSLSLICFKTWEKAQIGPVCVTCLSLQLLKVGSEAESLRRCPSPMNMWTLSTPRGGQCWADNGVHHKWSFL